MPVAGIRGARPGQLRSAAQAWDGLATALTGIRDGVLQPAVARWTQGAWRGDAAEAANRVCHGLDGEAEVAATQLRQVAALMRAAADAFEAVQHDLAEVIERAQAEPGIYVDAAGGVHPAPPGGLRPAEFAQLARLAQYHEALISEVRQRATEADHQFAQALRSLRPQEPEHADAEHGHAADARDALARLGLSPASIPERGTDPAAVAAWWRQLSADERRLLLAACPERIGALDGLSATVRDEANRRWLRRLIAAGDGTASRLANLLVQLEAPGPPEQRLHLLLLDPAGDGRAAIAVGNPDTARHTAILVPGMGAELDNLGGQIDRARNLQTNAHALAPNDGVSVIAWLGYDPPDQYDAWGAITGGDSRAGAAALDPFVDGLRVAHAGDEHLTVIGHSYGSTVVGAAAAKHQLAADDLVLIGSPGVNCDHARQLGLDPDHVWVADAAPGDLVARESLHTVLTPLNPALGWLAGQFESAIHGPAPHQEEFGARVFVTGTNGHSGYWDGGSPSLLNQAHIIVGQYDRVGQK